MTKNWIAGAIKHPGALRKTAKADGMIKGDAPITSTVLGKLKKSKNPKTVKRANLAQTLMHMKGK
jgi:hypothetical protein